MPSIATAGDVMTVETGTSAAAVKPKASGVVSAAPPSLPLSKGQPASSAEQARSSTIWTGFFTGAGSRRAWTQWASSPTIVDDRASVGEILNGRPLRSQISRA